MPANKKHLSTPLQRFAKITAGFIGGYILTQLFHMVLVVWWNPQNSIYTIRYAGFILWVTLLIVAFLAKNGWKIWGVYILIAIIFIAFIYTKQSLTI
ncbi:hypothetical protein CW731_04505 [Polaribacter sp. ALD11]|uniref:hypothetical protein n=1 Tax=Polaribacter sp. ALD11 TaxID=2058137 RepID=UPI000C308999|nr:hypothetical protein [Polaribacter sp. ALD11]AUC84607.1 hypothetical protein CW731_04505 [Polaribacter sp. ALD11]